MKNTPETSTTRLLTVSQASQQYAVCERIIRRWIAHREIPYLRIGGSVRLSQADMDAFVAKHRIEPLD